MGYLICLAAGTDTRIEGQENLIDLKDSVVCMFRYASIHQSLYLYPFVLCCNANVCVMQCTSSHASNLDGFIVNASSPTAFKVKQMYFNGQCVDEY